MNPINRHRPKYLNYVEVKDLEGGIISSVVPYIQTVLPKAVKKLTGFDIMVVGPGLKTGLGFLLPSLIWEPQPQCRL